MTRTAKGLSVLHFCLNRGEEHSNPTSTLELSADNHEGDSHGMAMSAPANPQTQLQNAKATTTAIGASARLRPCSIGYMKLLITIWMAQKPTSAISSQLKLLN